MTKQEVLQTLIGQGVIGIIRLKDNRLARPVVDALCAGGIRCLEITLTIPGAVGIIRDLRTTLPSDVLLGAGTVTDAAAVRDVVAAGAQFIVSPVCVPEVVAACRQADVVCIPGCSTATEIFNAWRAGADIIKLFPSRNLGPNYLSDIAGPFPQIKMMPTSTTIDQAASWIAAGAVAIGVGRDLLDAEAIRQGRFEVLTERAKTLLANVAKARS